MIGTSKSEKPLVKEVDGGGAGLCVSEQGAQLGGIGGCLIAVVVERRKGMLKGRARGMCGETLPQPAGLWGCECVGSPPGAAAFHEGSTQAVIWAWVC